ncbi:acetyltransferase [Allorhizocola rhizosphaerae]|uniref:acetyltransferase n=1 Tax=Allorhizocola rhizosphaerae TaxID=1872709 RepID=UPI000E3C3A1A|nr:acetyltransferase [Allorhizocola rhizosphaerae]
MRELVIVGAGGFARETASAVRDMAEWKLLGFLDDVKTGPSILGPLSLAWELPGVDFVVCVGSPRDYGVRERLAKRVPQRFATIVHPSVYIGQGCTVGEGSVLLPGVTLTAEVTVGAHVAVMPQVVLTHDDVVGDFVTIASGVRLGGSVQVGRGAYLGAGALVRESVRIGEGSLIGMGSVVLRDVPAGEIWVGNPARYLKGSGQA